MKKFFLAVIIINSLVSVNAQNVGIGTASPIAKLDVSSSTDNYVARFNGTNQMYIGLSENNILRGYAGSFYGAAEDVDFGTASGNAIGKLHFTIQASPKMTIVNSGNVGIGTITPAQKLDINGNLKLSGELMPNGIAGTNGQVLTSNGNGTMQWSSVVTSGNAGFGAWGDCATNANISEYYPVADTSGAAGDNFGISVSISGNYAIIGANGDDGVAGVNQGSASIYQWNGTNWVLMQKITDANGAADDYFGNSVSISGNYAIIGAYYDDGAGGINQGSASIYQWNGTSWILMQKIMDATGAADDFFGSSVSISGNYAIVGAHGDNDVAGFNQGSASIYQWNGTNWVLMQKITDATGAAGDGFGVSVSISGNYAIIGASGDDGIVGTDQGSASIYQWNGTNWILMQKITDDNAALSDYFGISVSISGNYAIIGASGDDDMGGTDQGSASIFKWNGTNWILMQKITDTNGAMDDKFGYNVSISGNYAIVGAYSDDIGADFNKGSASIYVRVGLAWQKLQYVTDPAGIENNYFGATTAIDGTTKRFLIGVYPYASSSGKAVFGKIN